MPGRDPILPCLLYTRLQKGNALFRLARECPYVAECRRDSRGERGHLADSTQAQSALEQRGREPKFALSHIQDPEIQERLAEAKRVVGGLRNLDRLLAHPDPFVEFAELAEAP